MGSNPGLAFLPPRASNPTIRWMVWPYHPGSAICKSHPMDAPCRAKVGWHLVHPIGCPNAIHHARWCKRQSEHPVVIRERQERRPKYQFSTVRLEGIEDNHNGNLRKNRNRVDDSEEDEADDHGHSKKSRVDFDSESDPDADGIPDNGEEFEPTQQKQQEATPRYHPLVDDFISLELMNAVELFFPGQVLAPQEVDRWNNKLARGIRWSHQSAQSALLNIQYLLRHLPPLLSAHAAIPEEDSCTIPTQSWALKRLANLKDSWIPQAFDDDTNVYTAYYHFCGAYENNGGRMTNNTGAEPGVFSLIQYFIGALAGLAFLSGGCVPKPKQSKIDSYRSKHHLQHVQMLANLVIFGPTSAFTAY
ncbi:hypothetical protein PGT21_017353 [Puccinia graminis f. sp. tritici]|uniref:Uncharacterized protein n=1 Tax=Puccinia graminis f. sp. tritici TaxID=56615 RepID=A0A5B0LZY6_PUCGR|nr:hypothetical protein PGT21_017353 [Puccinia graminis f. sp. tritici]